jgi:hypothetical protein
MNTGWLKAMAVLLLAVFAAVAAPPAKPSDKSKDTSARTTVKHLYGLDWHTKLDAALKQAAGDKTGGEKPVMVLRVLGDLDGFM